ncbi:hypothetical protein, partial [Modestobacter sp. SYSU DS0290]
MLQGELGVLLEQTARSHQVLSDDVGVAGVEATEGRTDGRVQLTRVCPLGQLRARRTATHVLLTTLGACRPTVLPRRTVRRTGTGRAAIVAVLTPGRPARRTIGPTVLPRRPVTATTLRTVPATALRTVTGRATVLPRGPVTATTLRTVPTTALRTVTGRATVLPRGPVTATTLRTVPTTALRTVTGRATVLP